MIKQLFFIALVVSVVSCKGKQAVTNSRDYAGYLRDGVLDEEIKKVHAEIDFWQLRLQKDTGSYVNMLELATNQFRLFRISGNMRALTLGDSLLKRSSAKLSNSDPEILYSLSQNSITQHRFLSAASYTAAAEKANGDPYTIRLLEFDINMELGRYKDAYRDLQGLKERSAFDYLVRRAKWEDHRGNLDAAIRLMEQAFVTIKDKKKSLYCWTLSNLADMYGHAGRVEEAYQSYLAVLKIDPSNLYCLKGIAWIAYSYDNNATEAKHILRFILSQTSMPELKLVLAEIADSEGKAAEKKQWLSDFISTVSAPGYGDMYNKYLIRILADEPGETGKAVAMAEKELTNRFTPETCDWLAWAWYKNGELAKALDMAKGYVYKRTFEPEALMHTAFIYAAAGNKAVAKELLEECLQSSFELGPVATAAVKEKLEKL